jgi:hypothetical protein
LQEPGPEAVAVDGLTAVRDASGSSFELPAFPAVPAL